jgi:hypothetical protein
VSSSIRLLKYLDWQGEYTDYQSCYPGFLQPKNAA